MRITTLTTAVALALCAAFGTGCGRNRAESPHGRYAMLQSPDAGDRREAAKDLMDDGGPSPDAVQHLIAALQRVKHLTGVPKGRHFVALNFQDVSIDFVHLISLHITQAITVFD